MAQNQLDLKALTEAVSKGIIAGTSEVVSNFATSADRRHSLANAVQVTTDKVYQLDKEMGLIKGYLTSLIGSGDGSTGLVPRLERDMQELKSDVTSMKGQMRELKEDVGEMGKNIKSILDTQAKQTSFSDGWRGVGVFIGIGATCITVIGGIVAAVLWLYGSHPAIGR